ncbi:MAG: hypothetical protein IE922_01575 [Sphingomonadales bacterium]|nr:hypothetical protein [Sphingomonadales bacterium]
MTEVDRVRAVMDRAEEVSLPEDMIGASAPAADDPGEWDGVEPDVGAGGDGPAPPDRGDGEAEPPEARCAKLPLNDFGNGQRFLEHHGDDVCNVPRVGWHLWTGTRWQLDPDEIAVRRLAQGVSSLIAKETRYLDLGERQQEIIAAAEGAEAEIADLMSVPKAKRTPEQAEALRAAQARVGAAAEVLDGHNTSVARRLTHAKNAGNTNAIKNMLTEAAVRRVVELDQLDADPLVINTENAVLRFVVTEEGGRRYAELVVEPHDRAQMLSKIMPVRYDPEATCPTFDRFIERVQPIPEMSRFLQRWLGLSITGLTGEQRFAFLYGSGANGKSVLMDLLLRLMGDYGASAKIESLTGSNRRGGGDATPDLMQLIGARFVRASEPDEGMRLQEALIKELTGGETMLVRALHTNFVEFRPRFKLTISGNHKPEIRGGDDGIWRRVLLVPFDIQIPQEERDANLGEKLWAERDGIFRWLVDGLLEYLERGLMVPSIVSDATKDYREESDPYGAFLSVCCHVSGDPQDTLWARDLCEAFNFWLDENGKGAFKPMTVSKKLAGLAGRWKHPDTGRTFAKGKSSISQYLGVRFAEPFGSRFRGMPRDAQGRILRNGSVSADE